MGIIILNYKNKGTKNKKNKSFQKGYIIAKQLKQGVCLKKSTSQKPLQKKCQYLFHSMYRYLKRF